MLSRVLDEAGCAVVQVISDELSAGGLRVGDDDDGCLRTNYKGGGGVRMALAIDRVSRSSIA